MTAVPYGLAPKKMVSLVCYDFDGVMTDNRVLVDETGREAVFVNRADGLAISAMRKLNIPQFIFSTETNPVVSARAHKLGIPVLQGLDDKAEALSAHLARHGYDAAAAVFIGNDLNDLEVMRMVGYPIAPADAHPTIKSIARHITAARGGEGVIREFFENFLCAAGV